MDIGSIEKVLPKTVENGQLSAHGYGAATESVALLLAGSS
jgi:hypothetical protein